jgi:uncharacterized iron-regulated protein
MLKSLIGLFLFVLMTVSISAQITDASYRIYDGNGNTTTLEKILDSLESADVVFLGENHDDPAAHFLQAEIFKRAFERYGKSRKVALSMEMFERDSQTVLNEYLQNLITEKKFLDDSRPWNNYKTDYRPLVEFAKQNNLPVIAANAPRRYVNMVSRNGREALNALSPTAKSWLAPLPYGEPSAAYTDKFKGLMKGMPESAGGLDKILASQSLWDATMAYSIARFLKQTKKPLVVQLNGGFHSESRLGTVDHLLRYRRKARVLVVTMKSAEKITEFDAANKNLGDFVILTDAKLPRSFKAN